MAPNILLFGFQSIAKLIDLGLSASNHFAISSLFFINGVNNKKFAFEQSFLIFAKRISKLIPLLSSSIL